MSKPCKLKKQENKKALEAYVNVKRWGQKVLLAVCDVDILGKKFSESDRTFWIKPEFYKGQKTSLDEAINLIENSNIVNLVGCNVVRKAIEKGYVHPEAVVTVCGVLHAQIVKI